MAVKPEDRISLTLTEFDTLRGHLASIKTAIDLVDEVARRAGYVYLPEDDDTDESHAVQAAEETIA